VTTQTQSRIAYTLAWLLLGAVQAMSEAWKPEIEPVPAVRQLVVVADALCRALGLGDESSSCQILHQLQPGIR
jgi:hypothetical protein